MRILAICALAGVSLCALTTSAFAQDTGPAETAADTVYLGDDIIVQARRKGEDIQSVPLVVQAVSSTELQRLEIRQFEDVTRVVPGLQLSTASNGFSTTASMRGVNFDAAASGSSTTVEFYRNDSVITSGALFQALYDIGQIEVLRGPQGTLRGRASPSGSITATTRRPDLDQVGGYMSGSLSTHSRWNINGALNVPIIEDILAVRVAGFTGESEGNRIKGLNVRTGKRDNNIYANTDALRASVRADPLNGVLILDFNYETIKTDIRQYDQVMSGSLLNNSFAASPVLITPRDKVGVTPGPRTTTQDFKIYNWQAQLNLWDQQLTYVGGKMDAHIVSFEPKDYAGLYASSTPINTPTRPLIQHTDSRNKSETHEIRLQNQSRVAGIFDYVIGGMRILGNTPTVFNNLTSIGSIDTLYSVSYLGIQRYRSDEENSLFGNITAHIGERIELSGGMRQIWFKADSGTKSGTWGDNQNTWAESASNRRCFGNSDVPNCKPTKKATIYNATAKYNITDNFMAYASYGTSWRPGNSVVGFRGILAGEFLDNFLNLPDETSKSYELGIKSKWFDNKLTFNISGYQQKFSNYAFRMGSPIVALSSPTGTPILADAFNYVAPVPAKIKGFEAELNYNITPSFNIGTSVAFADGKIRNGLFPCLDLNDDQVPDTTLPTPQQLYDHVGANQIDTCRGNASPSSASRWSGNVHGEYAMPVSNKAEGYLRGLVNWKGYNQGFGLNPYDQVKAFALLDVFAGIRDEDGAWDVTFFAKNVLNTRRVLTSTDAGQTTALRPGASLPGGGTSINSTNATNYFGITTQLPRELGVSMRFSFGGR